VVNTCLDVELRCTDPTGGAVTLLGQAGNATSLLEVRYHELSPGLGINACVKTSLRNQFGVFQVRVYLPFVLTGQRHNILIYILLQYFR